MTMKKQVDVLFVNPGNRKQIYQDLGDEFCAIEPPAFAGLFANYLKAKGFGVGIVDAPAFGLDSKQAAETIVNNYQPSLMVMVVYGYQPSASTQNMTAAGEICQFVKELNPEIKILMTGTHPAALPERTMREEHVDFVCDREGPQTILKTLQAIQAGTDDFSKIPSLWWRASDESIRSNPVGGLIENLDEEMPGIAWDLLSMDRYRAHNWHCFDHINNRSPYAAIHTSLGCPYRCTFCCINAPFGKPTYRLWHPDSVIKEIDLLVTKYGVKNIKFIDEMFVLNESHVLGICDRIIERDYDLNIWAYARVDTVQDKFLEKLKRAGVNWLVLGIESGSKHVRDGALKKFGNEDVIEAVRKIQNAGIYVLGNFIFGLPDDDFDSMTETFDLAVELNCEFANFYSAMAYPGSPLYAMAVEKGLQLPEHWHYYSQHSYDTLPLPTDYMTAADVLDFRDQAFHRYFTSERYLQMIQKKFGSEVQAHLQRMTKIRLKRKILEEREIIGLRRGL